jgi:hypothetical protein
MSYPHESKTQTRAQRRGLVHRLAKTVASSYTIFAAGHLLGFRTPVIEIPPKRRTSECYVIQNNQPQRSEAEVKAHLVELQRAVWAECDRLERLENEQKSCAG